MSNQTEWQTDIQKIEELDGDGKRQKTKEKQINKRSPGVVSLDVLLFR